MRRLAAAAAGVMVLLGWCLAASAADSAEWVLPETIGNFHYEDSLDFGVLVRGEAAEYRISAAVDGAALPPVTAVPGKACPLETGPLARGLHTLTAEISREGQPPKSLTYRFAVIGRTERSMPLTFSNKGFSAHFGQENNNGIQDRRLMQMLGIPAFRDELAWGKVEKNKGVLTRERGDQFISGMTEEDGMQMIFAADYNNDLYSGIPASSISSKYGPKSKEEFDGFARYAAYTAKTWPGIGFLQVWNEPHGSGFWKPGPNAQDYTCLLQVTAHEVRAVRPDIDITGGVFGPGSLDFYDQMMQGGAYPYYDTIAYHPYIYPEKVDALYRDKTQAMNDKVYREYGGWKRIGVSEVGWPTNTGSRGSTERQQAIELVKQMVLSDADRLVYNTLYDFRNDGTNPSDREQNFGVVHRDYTAKPAALTVKEQIDETYGAVYLGRLACGSAVLHCYVRAGKPMAAAWTPAGTEEVSFGDELVTVRDLYGNVKETSSRVTLEEEPVYLTGFSEKWLVQAVFSTALEELSGTEAYYDNRLSQAEADCFELWRSQLGQLLGAGTLPPLKALEDCLEDLCVAAENAVLSGYDPDAPLLASGKLFSFYWTAETLANLMTLYGEASNAGIAAAEQRYTELDAVLRRKEADVAGGCCAVAESMLRYGRRYAGEARRVSEAMPGGPAANGLIRRNAWLAETVADWAERVLALESPAPSRLVLQLPSSQAKWKNLQQNTAAVSLYNYGQQPFEGRIEGTDSGGNLLFRTEELWVPAGGRAKYSAKFFLDSQALEPELCVLTAVSEGKPAASQTVRVDIAGLPAVQSRVKIRSAQFTGPSGPLHSLEGTERFTAAVLLEQCGGAPISGRLYAAVYGQGCMTAVSSCPVELSGGGDTAEVSLSVSGIPNRAGQYVQLMLWDDTMRPLGSTAVFMKRD